jgi:hypothetical protein
MQQWIIMRSSSIYYASYQSFAGYTFINSQCYFMIEISIQLNIVAQWWGTCYFCMTIIIRNQLLHTWRNAWRSLSTVGDTKSVNESICVPMITSASYSFDVERRSLTRCTSLVMNDVNHLSCQLMFNSHNIRLLNWRHQQETNTHYSTTNKGYAEDCAVFRWWCNPLFIYLSTQGRKRNLFLFLFHRTSSCDYIDIYSYMSTAIRRTTHFQLSVQIDFAFSCVYLIHYHDEDQ